VTPVDKLLQKWYGRACGIPLDGGHIEPAFVVEANNFDEETAK
jgi:hypothetical protein